MVSQLLADFVLVAHLGFILFAVLGGLPAQRFRWAPLLHLPSVAWGALIEATGRVCPLTPVESALRSAGGDAGYAEGFIEHYFVPIVYPAELSARTQLFLAVDPVL